MFISQNMGKKTCQRPQHWGVSPLFKMVETKPVQSFHEDLTTYPGWFTSARPLHPSSSSLYHPLKPLSAEQMEKKIPIDPLALPGEFYPHVILLWFCSCSSRPASHEVMFSAGALMSSIASFPDSFKACTCVVSTQEVWIKSSLAEDGLTSRGF